MIKTQNIIFILLSILLGSNCYANEKFLKLKGNLVDDSNQETLSNYTVKVVLDDLDSTTTLFEGDKYDTWLPANRKAKVYFIKEGYISIYIIVDASFIPAFAYKKKQSLELTVKTTAINNTNKKVDQQKPFCIANFKSNENKFIIKYPEEVKKQTNLNFKPPFAEPVKTFKGVKPNDKNLETIIEINPLKLKKSHDLNMFIQGVIFSKMNYCIFNERVGQANKYLIQLANIDKNEWSNIKPFDSPEYGAIVMKTLNREKSTDTLFAFGAWIGTSQLLLQSFTSNNKIIIHGKKLISTLKSYKAISLSNTQNNVIKSLRNLAINYQLLIDKYMKAMKNKTLLNLIEDEVFIIVKMENESIYKTLLN